jgi:hypothetical protein
LTGGYVFHNSFRSFINYAGSISTREAEIKVLAQYRSSAGVEAEMNPVPNYQDSSPNRSQPLSPAFVVHAGKLGSISIHAVLTHFKMSRQIVA